MLRKHNHGKANELNSYLKKNASYARTIWFPRLSSMESERKLWKRYKLILKLGYKNTTRINIRAPKHDLDTETSLKQV